MPLPAFTNAPPKCNRQVGVVPALRAAAVFQRIDDTDHPLATRMDMQNSTVCLLSRLPRRCLSSASDQLDLQARRMKMP